MHPKRTLMALQRGSLVIAEARVKLATSSRKSLNPMITMTTVL